MVGAEWVAGVEAVAEVVWVAETEAERFVALPTAHTAKAPFDSAKSFLEAHFEPLSSNLSVFFGNIYANLSIHIIKSAVNTGHLDFFGV